MPEPALMFWILGVPLLLGIFDLIRTVSAIKRTPQHLRERGAFSSAVHVDGSHARQAPAAPVRSTSTLAGQRS